MFSFIAKRGQFVFNVEDSDQQQQVEQQQQPQDDSTPSTDLTLTPNGGNTGKKIVGYYTFWSALDINDIPGNALTHIMYAFANIDGAGRCVVGNPLSDTQRVFGVQDECGCCAKGKMIYYLYII